MKTTLIAAGAAAILILTAGVASAQMTDAQVIAKVQAEGYTNARVTEHEKDHVDVKAVKNGKTVKLDVDLKTGQVKPEDEEHEKRERK